MAPKAKAPEKAPAKAPAAPAKAAPKAAEKPAPAPKQVEKVVEKAPAPKAKKSEGKATRAFIYGLSFTGINRATVYSFLKRKCGPIYSVSLRKRWGRRGCVKVLFKTEEGAKRAKAFNGKKVKGNTVTVHTSSAEPPVPKNKIATTLFVSGLPHQATKKDVRSRFSQFGKVLRVRLYKQSHTAFDIFHPSNKYRGSNSGRRGQKAYVYFADAADARKAATKKAFRTTPRDAAHKLFIAPSYRTIEQDKRRATYLSLVEKAFNPRLLERERQRKRAAKESKKGTKDSKARKDSKTKAKPAAKKQAEQPKAAKPAAKAAAKKK